MIYYAEKEEWGVRVRAMMPDGAEAGDISIYNLDALAKISKVYKKNWLRIGRFFMNCESVSLRRALRFLGIYNQTDTAYPQGWYDQNKTVVDQAGGLAGWAYHDSAMGRPFYAAELIARIEVAIWSALAHRPDLLADVLFNDNPAI